MEHAREPLAKAPLGLIGMFVLIGIAECLIVRLPRDYATTGAWDWRQSQSRGARAARDAEILIFGDSQAKLGIVPGSIGKRTYNLALIGGQAASSYVMLKRAFEAECKPKAIIVDYIPALLAKNRNENLRQWPELLRPFEAIEMAWLDGDLGFGTRLALATVLPSIRLRDDLRLGVLSAFHGDDPAARGYAFHRRNWSVNQGAMLLANYGFKGDAATWFAVNYPKPWSCDGVNALYVNRFMTLAAEHGVTVYWLLPPVEPQAQAICEGRGENARYDAFVREVQATHPNLVVIDARSAGVPRSEFVDPVHLHAQGALALSAKVAEVLSGTPSRWNKLPAFQENPSRHGGAVEDLEQSRLAVANGRGMRR